MALYLLTAALVYLPVPPTVQFDQSPAILHLVPWGRGLMRSVVSAPQASSVQFSFAQDDIPYLNGAKKRDN